MSAGCSGSIASNFIPTLKGFSSTGNGHLKSLDGAALVPLQLRTSFVLLIHASVALFSGVNFINVKTKFVRKICMFNIDEIGTRPAQ
jgi:hypothetical protein